MVREYYAGNNAVFVHRTQIVHRNYGFCRVQRRQYFFNIFSLDAWLMKDEQLIIVIKIIQDATTSWRENYEDN